jgi:hypothetical protein
MRVLAIDPGTVKSAWCSYGGDDKPLFFGIEANDAFARRVKEQSALDDVVAIEMIASYGMAVGCEVFETCVWIGRFMEQFGGEGGLPSVRVFRRDVKTHLCNSAKAKDANIRQALIDRFGGSAAIGKKATPGPLYGVAGDVWAALAVAVTYADKIVSGEWK